MRVPLGERLAARTKVMPNGCWEFQGSRNRMGYGHFGGETRGSSVLAHRAAWTVANGPIPEGMCVLHRCDNPPCVRPDHLWLGTRLDNNRDMYAKGRNGKTGLPGERHNLARLTWDDVRELRRLYADGVSGAALGRKYGVSGTQALRVAKGEFWKEDAAA